MIALPNPWLVNGRGGFVWGRRLQGNERGGAEITRTDPGLGQRARLSGGTPTSSGQLDHGPRAR
jgi:hypothetical protein